MKEITLKMLMDKKACKHQIRTFRETFGKTAKINKTNARKARAAGLSVPWLKRLLSEAAFDKFDKATDAAWSKCRKIQDAYDDKYSKGRITYNANIKLCDSACEEYYKDRDAILVAMLLKL